MLLQIGDPLFKIMRHLIARHVLHHRLTRLLAFAAFLGTRLHVLVVGKLLARRATQVAGFRTALADQDGIRPTSRHDLGGGGTDSRTVLTGHQGRQVFLRAFMQHVGAVGGTRVARPLAVRAGFGTLLHHRIVFRMMHLLLRLPLLGECHHTDEGQRRSTETADFSSVHEPLLSLKRRYLDARDKFVTSTR